MDILITKETDSTEPSSMQEATHTDRYLHAESSSSTKIDGNSLLCIEHYVSSDREILNLQNRTQLFETNLATERIQ